MFNYTPLGLSVDPREKYLASIADAEYLSTESIRREEQALRFRLEEIQLQKQLQGRSLHQSAYGKEDYTSLLDIYGDRHALGYDRIASLRRQLEEEERLRYQVEEAVRLRRQVEEEKRLHALRQAELEHESRRREQQEQSRLLLALEKEERAALLRARLARARQESAGQLSQQSHYFARDCERTPSFDGLRASKTEVPLHSILRAIQGNEVEVLPGLPYSKPSRDPPVEAALPALLEQIYGSDRLEAIKPKANTPRVPEFPISPENIQLALSLMFGPQSAKQADHTPFRHQDAKGSAKLLDLALRQSPHAAASVVKAPATTKPSSSHPTICYPEVHNFQQVMDLFLRGDQKQAFHGSASPSNAQADQPSSSQPTSSGHFPYPEGFEQSLDLFTGGQQHSASQGSEAPAARSSSQVAPHAHPQGLQQFLDLFIGGHHHEQQPSQGSASSSKAQAAKPTSSQAAPETHNPLLEGFPQFLDLFLGGQQQQQQAPKASSSSNSQSGGGAPPALGGFEQFMNTLLGQHKKEQQSQAKPSTSAASEAPKHATSVESSLKAELESRLGNEYASEVRDTIQAILASLSDSSPTSASQSTPLPSSSESKGKEKASENMAAPIRSLENATSKDVMQALDEVHNIEAAFSALETEFIFPSQLDFLPSHLPPENHTSDSGASTTSHLAYTSRNHPVRFYEQALGSLLSQLDSVDSFGNEDLRLKRKHVVDKIEKALEELESEVEGRWRTRMAKELKSLKVTVTDAIAMPSEAPAETINGTVAQPTIPNAAAQDVPPKTEKAVRSPPEDASNTAPALSPDHSILVSPAPIQTPSTPESSVSVDTPSSDSTPADEPLLSTQAAEEASASVTASLAESVATVKPSVAASPEAFDTFLLPAYPPADSPKPKRLPRPEHDVDAGSDWSEIEA